MWKAVWNWQPLAFLRTGGLQRETIPGPAAHKCSWILAALPEVHTSAIAYPWGDILFAQMQWIRSVVFHSPSDLEEIQLDASRLDKLEEAHPFEEAQEGREIKGPPACSGVYACWTHEHVTDEQRRQRTIWGYIMVLSSMHNTVDIEKTTENTEMTETWLTWVEHLPSGLLWDLFNCWEQLISSSEGVVDN